MGILLDGKIEEGDDWEDEYEWGNRWGEYGRMYKEFGFDIILWYVLV